MLNKVKRRSLSFEKFYGSALELCDDVSVFDLFAVLFVKRIGERIVKKFKNPHCNFPAAKNAVRFCNKICLADRTLVKKIIGCNINIVNVLGNCVFY